MRKLIAGLIFAGAFVVAACQPPTTIGPVPGVPQPKAEPDPAKPLPKTCPDPVKPVQPPGC